MENDILGGPGRRLDDFLEETNRYRKGEIGLFDQMLQGGANAVGAVTDIPFAAAGAVASKGAELAGSMLPSELADFLKKGLSDISQGVVETEAGQAALEFVKENPQWMKRLGYVGDLSVIPAVKGIRNGVIPDLAMEASNKQPWFYGKGNAGKVASIAATGPQAVLNALNPRGAASRRAGVPLSLRSAAADITPEKRQKADELMRTSEKKKAAELRSKGKKKRTEEDEKWLLNYKEKNKKILADTSKFSRIKELKNKDYKGNEKVTKEEEEWFKKYSAEKAVKDEWLLEYKKDLSFVEGQLDQTQLLNRATKTASQGVVKSFEKVQQLAKGVLNADMLATATSLSILGKKNIGLTKDNLAVFEERMRKEQKMKATEEVEVVVRSPTAFSDIGKESLRGPSKIATRIFNARTSMQKHFPEKDTFSDADMRELVAITRLPDDTLYRTFGDKKQRKKANRVERAYYNLTESKRYDTNKKRTDSETIDFYYKYKRMEQEGKKLTKPQQKIYDGMKARVQQASENLDQRGDTVYFSGSHKSAAKGLGGVNDQFMINTKGDFVHFMNDENDLFGLVPPGHKRVLSVLPPNGYNMFKKAGRKSGTEQPEKQVFMDELEGMGAPSVNKSRAGMLEQAAVGIQKQDMPSLRASDFKNLAATGTVVAGPSSQEE